MTKFSFYKYENQIPQLPIFSTQQNDNKYFTSITKFDTRFEIKTEKYEITSQLEEDEIVLKCANNLQDLTLKKFQQVLCTINKPIEARFSQVRTKSLPISNFIADLINIFMATDCTLINSGSLRIDSVINEGDFE